MNIILNRIKSKKKHNQTRQTKYKHNNNITQNTYSTNKFEKQNKHINQINNNIKFITHNK